MNESYAERGYAERGYARGGQKSTRTGGQKSTRAGGVILAPLAILSTFLVLWGLYYATGIGAREKVALAAAGCEPNLSPEPANSPCTTVWDLERQWTKLTTPVIQQLNADVADYTISARRSLASAELALTAEVATTKAFDTSLARFPFPPAVAPASNSLIRAIQARITLTAEQARSSSLRQLRSFNGPVNASGAAIRTDLELVRKALFTRPTANQEP